MFANQSILEDREAFVFQLEDGDLTLKNPNRETLADQLELASKGLSDAGSLRNSVKVDEDHDERLL